MFIRLLMILLVAAMLPVIAVAQEVSTAVADASVGFDPSVYFVSLASLVGAVTAITQWLKKYVKTQGIQTKLLSWFVSVALCFVGWIFHLGILAGVEWYWILMYGLSAGLVANSIADLNIVTGLLNLFKTKSNG